MLIKDRDPAEKAVAQLTDLLSLNLSSTKKFRTENKILPNRTFCLEDINITPVPGASNQDAAATYDYAI